VSAPKAARATRLVVRASAVESRRTLMASVAAGLAALTIGQDAMALTPVDIRDDRKVMDKGFDLIYEARDLDIPQNEREGYTQARGDLESTKKNVAEAKKRIQTSVVPFVKKAYWTEAKEELRRQVGTLRFDLNTLASAKPKAEKKAALAAKAAFIKDLEEFDLQIRKKDQVAALKAYDTAAISFETILAKVF